MSTQDINQPSKDPSDVPKVVGAPQEQVRLAALEAKVEMLLEALKTRGVNRAQEPRDVALGDPHELHDPPVKNLQPRGSGALRVEGVMGLHDEVNSIVNGRVEFAHGN